MKPANRKTDAPAFHILSYIRVRPSNEKEKKTSLFEFNRRDVVVKNNASKILSFDKVFDEDSKQVAVYNTVVHPMIREVLQGYNCTVFAYGQTGTGKTYTMTGHQASVGGSLVDNVHAGIIPRAMEEIFKELSMLRSEYHVSVQYVELYNEKLKSLLTDAQEENIQLINDLEGGVTMKGIPPTPVKSKDEAFKLLLQGAERKQMAATSLNENSSRSHTIFIIIVKMRESIPSEKEDILRVGKLYLVDLAGSENVSKSGANDVSHKTSTGVNKRLAEASNINKSLLTLGRVITALTENSSHIPYRESKLTRILGDSLGGRTKTAIIGTVSPTHGNTDETESTLNYACKARAIKNKPEKNQTISKKEFMQFASEEILKLKRDLEATRQGDGFYITKESHEEMCNNMRSLEAQVKDWNDRYERLNSSYNEKSALFESLSIDFDEKCAEYEELDQIFKLESAKFSEKLKEVEKDIFVREFLIKEFEKTESRLTAQAKLCKSVIENLADQSEKLHDKIDRTMTNESTNSTILHTFKSSIKDEFNKHEALFEELFNKEAEMASHLAICAGKTLDKIHEETNQLFSKCEEVQEKLQLQIVNSESVQTNLISVIEEQLAHHKVVLQESNTVRIEALGSFLSGAIKPAFDKVTEHVMTLKKLITHISEDFKEVQNKQNNLVQKTKESEKSWKIITDRVLDDCSKLKVMFEDNLKQAKNQNYEDKLMVQKTVKVLELQKLVNEQMEELRTHQESSFKTKLEHEEYLKHCFEHSEEIETTLKRSTADLTQENAVTFKKLKKLLNENERLQKEMLSEVVNKIKGFAEEKEIVVQNLTSALNNKVDSLKQLSPDEETNCENLSHTLISHTDDLTTDIKSSLQLSCDFANSIKSEVKQNQERMSSFIREQHLYTESCTSEIQQSTSQINECLNNLGRTMDMFKYNTYVPTGQTPVRVNRKDLNYPVNFTSTAPRELLIQKFKHQENETISTSDLSSSEVSENGKTPLRNLNNVNKILKPSKPNTTPKLRRSLSVNDLGDTIEEDKENRRLTCSVKRQNTRKEIPVSKFK